MKVDKNYSLVHQTQLSQSLLHQKSYFLIIKSFVSWLMHLKGIKFCEYLISRLKIFYIWQVLNFSILWFCILLTCLETEHLKIWKDKIFGDIYFAMSRLINSSRVLNIFPEIAKNCKIYYQRNLISLLR